MQINKKFIYCIIRKKKILLTQEEWIRQHVIKFFVLKKGYNLSEIAVEVPILVNNIRKRIDIIVYKCAKPYIIIECKATNIIPSQNDFNQILIYNLVINSHYLMITNGIQHVFFSKKKNKFLFKKKIPDY
ncbi:MAG: type I restriction enzyme HsdR N-terminal domain-containing protein [Candidatus Bostrichicola ureolyticus]|nr:MAG: type I restriction enzyme HsdR N-terminal domain-containing protein [Candidatus Bostrichicola ureolyticus]